MQDVETALLLPHQVARRLGVTGARVRQLDAELRPTRTASGVRLYRPADVDRVAAERAARRLGGA